MLDNSESDMPAMPMGQIPIELGTTVYDAHGAKLGSVGDINGDTLVIKHGLLFVKELTVPLDRVRQASPDGVYLNITKDQVEQ